MKLSLSDPNISSIMLENISKTNLAVDSVLNWEGAHKLYKLTILHIIFFFFIYFYLNKTCLDNFINKDILELI